MENLSKRVFVVDDDQGILDSFEVLLGDQYHLLKAESGFEALHILETDTPQVDVSRYQNAGPQWD